MGTNMKIRILLVFSLTEKYYLKVQIFLLWIVAEYIEILDKPFSWNFFQDKKWSSLTSSGPLKGLVCQYTDGSFTS